MSDETINDETPPAELLTCVSVLEKVNKDLPAVLHLDPSMQHGENFLPVMNLIGDDGYYLIPTGYRTEIARWFGPDYAEARKRVDAVNKQLGFTPEQASDIVLATMARSRPW